MVNGWALLILYILIGISAGVLVARNVAAEMSEGDNGLSFSGFGVVLLSFIWGLLFWPPIVFVGALYFAYRGIRKIGKSHD